MRYLEHIIWPEKELFLHTNIKCVACIVLCDTMYGTSKCNARCSLKTFLLRYILKASFESNLSRVCHFVCKIEQLLSFPFNLHQ